jgi:hypothetical protein
MDRKRTAAVRDLAELDDRLVELVTALKAYRKTMLHMERSISDGRSVRTALARTVEMMNATGMTETLEAFERARHESRLSLVALAAEEGASNTELGDILGVSRQLVGRWVTESQGRADLR